MNIPITLIASSQETGLRLDVFLHTHFPQYSRSTLSKHIAQGNILLNKDHKKPSYVLKNGDQVEIHLPKKQVEILTPNNNLQISVLYEDKNILVINKPAGIQIHPSATENQNTLTNWLVFKYPGITSVGADPTRPGIVHRLDKDTSGVLVIAKTQESFEKLKKLFSEREIKKTYTALVYGILSQTSGTINKPIARSATFRKQVIPEGRTKFKGIPREAITKYEVLQTFQYSNTPYSLLTVHPQTGRMHQIRVHLSSIGHPIVGDVLYKRKEFKAFPTAKRQLLHAQEISFTLFGKEYVFNTSLPKDFRDFMKRLKD